MCGCVCVLMGGCVCRCVCVCVCACACVRTCVQQKTPPSFHPKWRGLSSYSDHVNGLKVVDCFSLQCQMKCKRASRTHKHWLHRIEAQTMPRTATWHMVPPSDFETYRQVNNTKDIDNYSCHLFVAWSLAPHPADKKQQSARHCWNTDCFVCEGSRVIR